MSYLKLSINTRTWRGAVSTCGVGLSAEFVLGTQAAAAAAECAVSGAATGGEPLDCDRNALFRIGITRIAASAVRIRIKTK